MANIKLFSSALLRNFLLTILLFLLLTYKIEAVYL